MELEKSIVLGLKDIKEKLHYELNETNCIDFYFNYVIKANKDKEPNINNMGSAEKAFHKAIAERKDLVIDKFLILYNCSIMFGCCDLNLHCNNISILNALEGLYTLSWFRLSWSTDSELKNMIEIAKTVGINEMYKIIINEIDIAIDMASTYLGNGKRIKDVTKEIYGFNNYTLNDNEGKERNKIINEYSKKALDEIKKSNFYLEKEINKLEVL